MECEQAREFLSAGLDNQLTGDEEALLDAHLETCAGCDAWGRRLAGTVRRYRLGPAEAPVMRRPANPPRSARNRGLRSALAWIGLLLIVWHMQALLAVGTGSTVHLERHQAGFAVALGIGFLIVAIRPDRAYGVRPLASAFTAVLVLAVAMDVVGGSTRWSAESRHLIEICGLVILWLLGTEMGPGRAHDGSFGRLLISGFRR